MTLNEIAIEAYKKKKAEQDKKDDKEANDFCKGAIEALKEQFGDIDLSKVEMIEKLPGSVTAIIENDIIILITKSQGFHHFRMIKKCEKCGAEYSDDIRKIEDIGKFLLEEHLKSVCDNNVKMKNVVVPTTEEKLIIALREFVWELQDQ